MGIWNSKRESNLVMSLCENALAVHNKLVNKCKVTLYLLKLYIFLCFPDSLKKNLVLKKMYFRERAHKLERDRGRGRSRLTTEQGAWHGGWSQNPGIMTWTKGKCLTNWTTQAPQSYRFLMATQTMLMGTFLKDVWIWRQNLLLLVYNLCFQKLFIFLQHICK